MSKSCLSESRAQWAHFWLDVTLPFFPRLSLLLTALLSLFYIRTCRQFPLSSKVQSFTPEETTLRVSLRV